MTAITSRRFWLAGHGREIITMVLLALVALVPRLVRIESAPPGLNGDEMFNAIDALRLGPGRWQVFFEGNFGREALFLYLMAASLNLFGQSLWAIRLPAVILGVGVVLLAYGIGRVAFNRRVALVAGLLIAVSLWPVMQSRWGLRAVSLTFFTALTVLLLMLAMRRAGKALGLWLAAGLALGLTLYTYIPGRVFPLVIVAWVAWIAFSRRATLGWTWRQLALTFLVALVVFAPFGLYMATYPEKVNQRIDALSGANALEKALQGEVSALLETAVSVPLMFVVKGDTASRYNIDARPIFDPVTGIIFAVGLLTTILLAFRRQAPDRRAEYGLLLLWMAAMLAPNLITGLDTSFLRGAGAIVPIYLITAIGLDTVYLWLIGRWPQRQGLWRAGLAGVVALGGLLILVNTWQGYFNHWINNDEVRLAYRAGLAEIGTYLAQNAPGDEAQVFIAYDYVAETTPQEFAYYHDGPVTWFHHANAFGWRPGADAPAWVLVTEQRPLPEALLSRLEAVAQAQTFAYQNGDPAFTLYSLDPAAVDWTPGQETALEFESGPTLIGFDMPETLTRGQIAPIVLHWRIPDGRQGLPNRLTYAQIFLEDSRGNVWQLAESLQGYPEAGWQAGDRFVTLMNLTVPQGMPPGPAYLRFGLRDWQGEPYAQLVADGQRSGPYLVLSQPVSDLSLPADATIFGKELALLEVTMSSRVAPGLPTDISLDWQALSAPADDYRVEFQVTDGLAGQPILVEVDEIWPDTYPTSLWQAGEQVTSFHRLHIPLDVPDLDAPWLRIGLLPSSADEQPALSQGDNNLVALTIERRERLFEIPPITNPLDGRFGQRIRLLGYDLDATAARPGGQLEATLYWQAIDTPVDGYTVFNHLVGDDSQIRGQFDGLPSGDAWFTGSWLPGEIVVDRRTIPIDADAPLGQYTLYVGLYTAGDGQRLPAFLNDQAQAGDRLPLTIVTLGP
jgi:4-amino-4-deoxy-L-arabinose transferase-like glycosyltransferase